jgi:hypothetical protein
VRDSTPSLEELSTSDLTRLRSDLNISLALSVPGSAAHVAAERELGRVASVLDSRQAPRSDRPWRGPAHRAG